MKRGIEEWVKTLLLVLTLGIIFAMLAYAISAGMAQKATETISAKVLSRLGGIESLQLPGLGKKLAGEQEGLAAVIAINPRPPACSFEKLELSALNSKLPQGITFTDIVCSWDLDTSVDTNGDKILDNDEDSKDCFLVTDDVTVKTSTNIKLKIKITGDVPGSGSTDTATASINTTMLCACDPESCTNSVGYFAGKMFKNGEVMVLNLPQKIIVEGVHITVHSGSENVSDLRLDVGDDLLVDYTLDGSFIGEFTIDGSEMFAGRSLVSSINTYLATNCITSQCQVPITWRVNKEVRIFSIYVPYITKPF